jgi:DNA-binding NarL/FixJ family response regulator
LEAYDPPMGRIASPAFVGRAAELAALDDALDAVEQGQTTTVLIGGDAGVGKTRLLQTWNERAAKRGARIAAGSCLDLGESGPAYASVIEALRELLGAFDPDDEEALVGRDRTVLARLVPELGQDVDPETRGRQAATFAQTRLFHRLVDVLQRAAESKPVVLELEDIHWADRSSQAFLLYLVEVSRRSNLLLIGTYRPEVADTDQAFRTTLGQLLRRPRVATLPIPPFDQDELREQLTGILGAQPSNELLAAIQARSEGNALFAEELAAARDPHMDLPASVGASTASKVDGLSLDTRAVLRAASVVGRTASYEVLRQVTELRPGALDGALREAVQARLLEPVHVREAYRFRHALLQEAIYGETLPGERRRLHGAVARALSADPERPADAADLAPRLARHWYEAREYTRAFLASGAAAAAADGQSAYAEAATHYERMLELWDRVDNASRDVSRAEVCARAAWAAFLAADYERSAAHGQEALAALEQAPDDALKIRVLDRLAWTTGRSGLNLNPTLRVLAALDPVGRPAADQLLIQVYRARTLEIEGHVAEALERARPLVEEARQVGDVGVYAEAAIVYAHMLQLYDLDAALRVLEPVKKAVEQAGDDVVQANVNMSIGDLLLEGQRFEQLATTIAEALEAVTTAGLGRWAKPALRYALALAHLRLGQLAETLEQVELGVADAPSGLSSVQLHLVAAEASTAMGALEAAAEHLFGARLPYASPEEELGRGWLATARAQLALAERRLDDVRTIVDPTAQIVVAEDAYSDMSETIWWLVEVGLSAEADRAEQARAANDARALALAQARVGPLTAYVEAVRRQREKANIPDDGRMDGYEALIAGHVARIEGHDEPGLWATAAESFPSRSVLALTARYRQAEAMLAARTPREVVREVMVPAHEAAVEIGARPIAARLEELARRARIRLTSAPTSAGEAVAPPAAATPGRSSGAAALAARGLSDREIEVLTLVAAGSSNADIAGRLFISSKTASVHVSHILDKLDASTRTEAATIGVRLGLPEVDAGES